MRTKWYIEFPLVLLTIAAAIVFALNINFFSASKTAPSNNVKNNSASTAPSSPEQQKWAEGRSLFKSNCAACHNVKFDGTGPALAGVTDRWKKAGSFKGKTGEQWLYIWIINWHDAVDAGYPYAIDMKNSRAAEMNVFKGSIQDKDIDAILFYVQNPDLFTTAQAGKNITD